MRLFPIDTNITCSDSPSEQEWSWIENSTFVSDTHRSVPNNINILKIRKLKSVGGGRSTIAVEMITVEAIAVEMITVEVIAVETITVETIAVEMIAAEAIAVETNAVERINTELHYGYS